MIAISCDSVTLAFGTDIVLEKIAFALNEGDKLGIVGVNGAGKSSLFRVITGEYVPESGEVYVARGKRIGMLDQNLRLDSSRTVLDETLQSYAPLMAREKELESLQASLEQNAASEDDAHRYAVMHDAFTAAGGYEYRGRCRGMLRTFGFDESFWELSVSSLSGGQKTRLALVKLLLEAPDILLLDEPTNHLDTETLLWLEDYLRSNAKTLLVISHDRYFLDHVTNCTLEIENRHAKFYPVSYTGYLAQKKSDREIQERHYKNQQREIERIEAYIAQQRRWNRERNIIAAESREKQLAKMERVERPDALPDAIRMRFRMAEESGNDVLSARRLAKGFPGKPLFSDVDFLIKKRERVFFAGKNGCGKSTLMKMIAGQGRPDSGVLEIGYQVKIGYYDQENQNLDPQKTVLDTLWDTYSDLTQTEIRNTLALFLFRGDDVVKPVSVLSGGEKARLTLAKLMLSRVNVLVLDEPTNHLDIPSREALEQALFAFEGTVIAVSHDRYFAEKLATRVLAFRAGEPGLDDYRSGYNEYLDALRNRAEKSPSAEKNAPATEAKEQYLQSKKRQSDRRKYEHQVKMTQGAIERTEQAIEAIDTEMEGEAATDYARAAALYEEKTRLEEELLHLYATWEELQAQGKETP